MYTSYTYIYGVLAHMVYLHIVYVEGLYIIYSLFTLFMVCLHYVRLVNLPIMQDEYLCCEV